jgi:hypothetical protein
MIFSPELFLCALRASAVRYPNFFPLVISGLRKEHSPQRHRGHRVQMAFDRKLFISALSAPLRCVILFFSPRGLGRAYSTMNFSVNRAKSLEQRVRQQSLGPPRYNGTF